MQAGVPVFISALRRERDFDGAATAVLKASLDFAAKKVAASVYSSSGRLLRGIVHLRPDSGYRSLVVLESGSQEATEAGKRPSFLPSATAWRWIEAKREPIAIDVLLGAILRVGGARVGDDDVLARPFEGDGSILRLIERDATHILVLPLIAPSQRVVGMISIEAACKPAVGHPFIWPEAADELQLLADLATPYLAALPLRPTGEAPDPLLPVIGASMTRLVRVLRSFAAQEETILLQGPTGVGKSRLARSAHSHSRRKDGPFEVIDLVSFPEEMQMAELFGWRKGAFTGAQADHAGAVARAEGGTLFIDEIGNLSTKAQAGLLHLLEDRRYRALGESGPERKAEVRFIVATHAELGTAVAEKRFREDLYYRINVLPLRLPPLRERADEIAPWATYMLQRAAASFSRGTRAELTPAAIAVLEVEAWPGNLRQLDNVVRRALAMARAESGPEADTIVTDEAHVRSAMAFDVGGDKVGVVESLALAANAFVAESERLQGKGDLDLDASDAFAGMVLLAAIRRYGSAEEAFRRLGKKELVTGRNHHKALRRAVARVAELYQRLGREPGEDVREILGS